MSSAQPSLKPASYFGSVAPIKFEGLKSDNPLAFRYYNKDQIVLGKRMEDLLRPAVCYWHSFAWNGHDIFGQGTFDRPWNAGVMDQAAAWAKMDAAFDFFTTLGTPFYCFHDVDAMPTASNIKEHVANLRGDDRPPREEAGRDRHQAALGHGQPVLASALHGRRFDESGSGCVGVRGHAGASLHGRHQASRRR